MLFHIGRGNQRLDGLFKKPLLADTAALARAIFALRANGVGAGTVNLDECA
jgi:hypothetical protein